jgi:K+-transporting ATPase ATPase C chain
MLRQLKPAIMSVIVITLFSGFVFPFAVTAIARLAFPRQAAGSLIVRKGRTVGSSLIGQPFTSPGYFHPRPSAAGAGYDGGASAGTNLGPTSDKLIHGIHNKLPNGEDDPGNYDGIQDLARRYREENGLAPEAKLPADAVTRSASGLDPDISPENATLQCARVARARGLAPVTVLRLVASHTRPPQFGLLGESRVNVLELNLALDDLGGTAAGR